MIGPTPPPVHGVAFMTAHVLDAIRAIGLLAAHLDTRDPRPVVTTGRLDARNLWLGIAHAGKLVAILLRQNGAAVYLPLSQGTWGFLRDAVLIWIAVLFRRRVIVHLHGGSFGCFARSQGPVMRAVIRHTVGHVDQAWVLTSVHRAMFDGLLPPSRVKVLANTSQDFGQGLGDIGRKSRIEPTRRFLYLSNLLAEKGLFDLLEALELLGERVGGSEFRFAGEAQAHVLKEFRARAAGLATQGVAVRWEGVLTDADKAAAHRWAQVFILPSRYPEGQPVSVIEAMSAGSAVIGTDRGRPLATATAIAAPMLCDDPSGIPCTVRNGKEGLIVSPGTPSALAEAIMRLIDEPALRQRLGDAARRRYLERYRPEAFHMAVAKLLRGWSPNARGSPASRGYGLADATAD